MVRKIFFVFIFLGLIGVNPLFSQDTHEGCSDETESTVKELNDMHEIIYPIWHQAYPEKDIPALKNYVGEVNKYTEKIFIAKLPGILRDKQAKWESGVAELKKSVQAYNDAAHGTDDESLLKAAEELHAKYEMLVRIIRPLNKEIDAFHKELYKIYHYYMPEKNYSKIKEVTKDLIVKSEAITKSELSKRLEPKRKDFEKAAADLVSSVKKLDKTAKGKDKKAIDKAVNFMHDKYQALEKIFD